MFLDDEFNEFERNKKEAAKTPWVYEKEDVRELRGIIKKRCPDGNIGPMILTGEFKNKGGKNIEDPDEINQDTDIEVGLNPIFIEISGFFNDKYSAVSKDLPDILFTKFIQKYLHQGIEDEQK
ncbi:MAG: hypothetical protein U9R36_03750 [Elusimicrobiota bacterium]|nr:hypothetical protein [Elusimicrobiota bacterium]